MDDVLRFCATLSSISKILRTGFHGATILVSQTILAVPQCLRIVLFNLTIAPSPNILLLNSSAILPWDDRNILTPTPFPPPSLTCRSLTSHTYIINPAALPGRVQTSYIRPLPTSESY